MSHQSREADLYFVCIIVFAFVLLSRSGNPDDLKEIILAVLQAVEANSWPACVIAIAGIAADAYKGKK